MRLISLRYSWDNFGTDLGQFLRILDFLSQIRIFLKNMSQTQITSCHPVTTTTHTLPAKPKSHTPSKINSKPSGADNESVFNFFTEIDPWPRWTHLWSNENKKKGPKPNLFYSP